MMRQGECTVNKQCRACEGSKLYKFLDLGLMPLINNFVKTREQIEEEPFYPLEVYRCQDCGLVQLIHVVPPEAMFGEYTYLTSTSSTMVKHLKEMTDDIYNRFLKGKKALALDIGSNDGSLLKGYPKDVNVLGIEPARNVAKIANDGGVRTINKFFSEKTAKETVAEHDKADAVTFTNVFAHIDDWHDIIKGLHYMLKDDGVLVIEAPYLIDFLEKVEFDTVYHEHLSYVSLGPLVKLFPKFGMEVFDVKRVPIHGGTLRFYVCKKGEHAVTSNVTELLEEENRKGLNSLETYTKFAQNVEKLKEEFVTMLKEFKKEGKRIAGYGAAAKGNVLLNYFKVGPETIDYIVDKNPLKQNQLAPGTHIPVYDPERLKQEKPDYMVILPWNISKEIMEEQKWFKEAGGKFVIPIPKPTVV